MEEKFFVEGKAKYTDEPIYSSSWKQSGSKSVEEVYIH